jgi:hypothetical protein
LCKSLRRSLALKLQIDRIRPKGDAGLLLRATPGFTGPMVVSAIALDWVFEAPGRHGLQRGPAAGGRFRLGCTDLQERAR